MAMEARRDELLRVDIGADPALQHEWAELCQSLDDHASLASSECVFPSPPLNARSVLVYRSHRLR